ncbi:MAG: glucose-1-phosphate adenylyltransferase [Candidatus Omnitrophica bacterium]|nr:glucose-1-phosphate adenylyltransferase [Candidatus Omnitrophota bacterium]
MKSVLAFVMAGGKGERLMPLTRDRAKPSVPFGGIYRIIDFTLSNCINSGIRKIHVLTQYKSMSLVRHLLSGWNLFNSELGEYIDIIHPQQRIDEHWYQGTADSVYQNLYAVEMEKPDFVLILAGDHVYKMNYAKMIDFHVKRQADLTVGIIRMPKEKAPGVGVAELDEENRILKFLEKPAAGTGFPVRGEEIFASMGIYLFNRRVLEEELTRDAGSASHHDFGKDILPSAIGNGRQVFAFALEDKAGEPAYWRDVGTVDAYYESNMDLTHVTPIFNLYDQDWPIRTYLEQYPPAKFVWDGTQDAHRVGHALNSLVANGCIISGSSVRSSILSSNVRVNSFAEVTESILLEGVQVGRYAKIRRSIVDKDVKIPPWTVIGFNPEEDRRRFHVTPSGITVVAKGTEIA